MAASLKYLSAILLIVASFNVTAGQGDVLRSPIRSEEVVIEKSFELEPRTYTVEKGGEGDEDYQKYKDHFLACRAKEPSRVNDIVKAVKAAKGKDVVLYFHGGLSSQKYMVTELGPWLMKSVFEQESIEKQIYPIFINYDAGVWDWDIYSLEINKVIKGQAYKRLLALVRKRIGARYISSFTAENQAAVSKTAANLLYKFDNNNSGQALSDLSEEAQVQYLTDILQAEILPMKFVNKHNKLHSDLGNLAKSFQAVDFEYAEKVKIELRNEVNSLNSGINKKLVSTPASALRVIRILARMALGNDHGLDATVAEEVFDALKISDLGQAHWTKVKKHSKQCFAEGGNGRNLIDQLLALRGMDVNKIHTWSHSAGSIPTAELINYLGNRSDNKELLGQVQMVAPAINQHEFTSLVLPNKEVFDHLQVYALTQKFERDDQLILGMYPASLLYAVSSLADKTYYLDKMLIIDQHMQPLRRPYKSGVYQALTKEKPVDVWEYFLGGNGRNANLYVYPMPVDTAHIECRKPNKKCGSSHEGTKLPWLSTDLTRRVMEQFGIPKAQELKFREPHQ